MLTVDTLVAFWCEDTSDKDYVHAACAFFWVSPSVIEKCKLEIKL